MLVTKVPMKIQPKIRPILRVSNVSSPTVCTVGARPYSGETGLEETPRGLRR
jgi:hypothetical protein